MRTPNHIIPAPAGWRVVTTVDRVPEPDNELMIWPVIAWAVFTSDDSPTESYIRPLVRIGPDVEPLTDEPFGIYSPDEWLPRDVRARLENARDRAVEDQRYDRLIGA